MKQFKIFSIIIFLMMSNANACRYTIREIGFSSLSNSLYTLYRIDKKEVSFPSNLSKKFLHSNVNPYAILFDAAQKTLQDFVTVNKLKLPAYILKDKNGRMLAVKEDQLFKKLLGGAFQKEITRELPARYATVLLVEGFDATKNLIAKSEIQKALLEIKNIMLALPKSVENPPNLKIISPADFDKEKILLWSLGLKAPPENPTAFIFYGKGRLMGDAISKHHLTTENIYRLLSFIGADCECGLDRKWMFGYQIPLLWDKKTQNTLQKILDFDVENPMVLTEMGRILATKKKELTSDEAISFKPVEVNINDEIPFDEEAALAQINESDFKGMIFWTIGFFVVLVGIVIFVIIKRTA